MPDEKQKAAPQAQNVIEIHSLMKDPHTISYGSVNAKGEQGNEVTVDGQEHSITLLYPGFDETKLGSWEDFANEIVRIGRLWTAISKGTPVVVKRKAGDVTVQPIKIEEAQADGKAFFPADLIDSPVDLYNILVNGIRLTASGTGVKPRLKKLFGPPGQRQRGGPKSVSADSVKL